MIFGQNIHRRFILMSIRSQSPQKNCMQSSLGFQIVITIDSPCHDTHKHSYNLHSLNVNKVTFCGSACIFLKSVSASWIFLVVKTQTLRFEMLQAALTVHVFYLSNEKRLVISQAFNRLHNINHIGLCCATLPGEKKKFYRNLFNKHKYRLGKKRVHVCFRSY